MSSYHIRLAALFFWQLGFNIGRIQAKGLCSWSKILETSLRDSTLALPCFFYIFLLVANFCSMGFCFIKAGIKPHVYTPKEGKLFASFKRKHHKDFSSTKCSFEEKNSWKQFGSVYGNWLDIGWGYQPNNITLPLRVPIFHKNLHTMGFPLLLAPYIWADCIKSHPT